VTPVEKPSKSRPQVTADVFTPELVCNYDPEKFNPRGVYYILGSKPKGFRDFHSLQLAVDHVRHQEMQIFKPIRTISISLDW
jgi:hypothetical protein